MNFSHALERLKGGRQARWKQWPQGVVIGLYRGCPQGEPVGEREAQALGISRGTIRKFPPYLLISFPSGEVMPYMPQAHEVVGNLWEVLDDE